MDQRERILRAGVRLRLSATGETEAIRELAESLREEPDVIDFDGFVAAVLKRQQIDPPVLGEGIAMPHARTECVRSIVTAFGIADTPIPFGPGRTPVQFLVLIGTPPNRASEYLAWVSGLVRRLARPDVRAALLVSATPADCLRTLAE
ncbi:MAG: PTS sugar transporter subunit IIA [Planctomycetota bacterium]